MSETNEKIERDKVINYIKDKVKIVIVEILTEFKKSGKKFYIVTIDDNVIYADDFDTPKIGQDYADYVLLIRNGKVIAKVWYNTIDQINEFG